MERLFHFFLLSVFLMFGFVNNVWAGYSGPSLKMPLPSGDSWLLNTAVNDSGDRFHQDAGYYSLDFDDDKFSDGYGNDLGDCLVDVLAAANGIAYLGDDPDGYGNYVWIDHGDGYSTVYGHLCSFDVESGDYVQQGQVLGKMGTTGNSTGVHLHFQIRYNVDSSASNSALDGVTLEGVLFTDYYVGTYYASTNTEVSASLEISGDAYNAIDVKADELWAQGFISYETANMHWWGDSSEPYLIVEDWDGGSWGAMVITYDPEFNTDRAYVLRSGFWDAYQLGGPGMFGSPIGDEMDLETDDYEAHDSYCGTDKDYCIETFCGSTDDYSSMQRFSGQATFCWHRDTWQACLSAPDDVGGEYLPYCQDLEVEDFAVVWPNPGEFIRGDESEAIYYYDGSVKRWISQEVWNYCNYSGYTEYDQEVVDSLSEGSYWTGSECQPAEGTLFKSEDDDAVYLMESGYKKWISSSQFYDYCGYSWSDVQVYSQELVDAISEGSAKVCQYPSAGELIRGEDDDAVFIMDGGYKKWISSDLFDACGYSWSNVHDYDQYLVDAITQGNHWDLSECLSEGELIKGDGSDAIFRYSSGTKHWVSEPQYYACGYSSSSVHLYDQSLVDAITQGSDQVCSYPSEGELFRVSGSPTVYMMSGGTKHWVVNAETFEGCGYSWGNIHDYISRVVSSVPTGSNWTLGSCLPNGSLVRNTGNNGIYYVSGGYKRWIPSAAVYEGCGFSWSAYVNYSSSTVSYIPSGSTYACW